LAAEGNVDELKELLNSGVNVNACGYDSRTALHLAASQGKLDVVKLLLERGANVNAIDRFGSTPLNDALQARRSDIAAYLRQHGSSLGERQGALIQKVMQSAAQGNVDLLVSVFENSFLDVADCYDYDKRTPLHLAAANGHFEATKYLLGKGADPNVKDRFGNTPIDEARREGHADVAELILKAPSKPNIDEEKEKIMDQESLREHYGGVKKLLLQHKLYSESLITSELDWYYNDLGLPPYYFARFPPEEAYRHVEAYIAAKQVAFANGTAEDIRIDGVETVGGTVFICPNEHASNLRVEEAVENLKEKWLLDNANSCMSLLNFSSTGPAIPHGTRQVSFFILVKNKFPAHEKFNSQETNLKKIAGANFSTWRRKQSVQQFQQIVDLTANKISPAFIIYPQKDGLSHVMFAYRRDSYSLPLHKTSQILASNGISGAKICGGIGEWHYCAFYVFSTTA